MASIAGPAPPLARGASAALVRQATLTTVAEPPTPVAAIVALPPAVPEWDVHIARLKGAAMPETEGAASVALGNCQDPYVEVKLDGVVRKTSVQDGAGTNCAWRGETLPLPVFARALGLADDGSIHLASALGGGARSIAEAGEAEAAAAAGPLVVSADDDASRDAEQAEAEAAADAAAKAKAAAIEEEGGSAKAAVVALGADDDDERFEEQEGGAVAFLDEVSRQEQRAAQVATLSLTVWNVDCPLDDTVVGAADVPAAALAAAAAAPGSWSEVSSRRRRGPARRRRAARARRRRRTPACRRRRRRSRARA